MRNHHPIVAAAVAALAALVACGGGTAREETLPPDATQVDGAAAGQAFDPDADVPAAPIAGAVAGGTVTALGTEEPTSMDPTEAYTQSTLSILSGLVTRSLTQYVFDPASQSMVVVPDIATDTGTPNADFTEWSFTIRDGVRFEDGTTVTAEDVAFGIKRSFDRKTFQEGPAFSNFYFLDGDSYLGVYTSGTSYRGVVVEGDTVTVKMARPFPDMPYWAAFPAMGPIPERGSDPGSYGRHPLATGPYMIADFTPGESLTLVRNEQWDPDTDAGRHQYPDRFEFRFGVPSEQVGATILGDSAVAQTALSTENVSVDEYRRAQTLDRLTLGAGPCTYGWYLDINKIPDIRVRQAIGYAYPYQEAARRRGEIFGVTSLPGTSILPPGFPGRRSYDVLDIEPGSTDPEKAQALLGEAGLLPGEFEVTFPYITSDPVSVAVTETVVPALEAAGFKAKPYPVSTIDDYFSLNEDPHAPINVRTSGWCPDWPSGSAWFQELFKSGSKFNFAQLDEPTIDAEIERIRQLPVEEQAAAWGALDESIMTDFYPVVVTHYPGVALLHGPKVGGMHVDAFTKPTWKDMHVIP